MTCFEVKLGRGKRGRRGERVKGEKTPSSARLGTYLSLSVSADFAAAERVGGG